MTPAEKVAILRSDDLSVCECGTPTAGHPPIVVHPLNPWKAARTVVPDGWVPFGGHSQMARHPGRRKGTAMIGGKVA